MRINNVALFAKKSYTTLTGFSPYLPYTMFVSRFIEDIA